MKRKANRCTHEYAADGGPCLKCGVQGGLLRPIKRPAKMRVVKHYHVRLPNRRVAGALLSDGSIAWRFKALQPDGKVMVYGVRLSLRAAQAMVQIIDAMYRDPLCRPVMDAAIKREEKARQ